MQDHKMAAANDQEPESKHSESEMHDFTANEMKGYCVGVLAYLESMTGKKLDDMAAELWINRLSKYSKQKLKRLQEYTGSMSNEVFKYLDELRDGHTGALESLKSLPEPKSSIAADCVAYMAKMRQDEYAYTEKGDQLEREFMAAMKIKYPRVSWICGRRGNRNYRTP